MRGSTINVAAEDCLGIRWHVHRQERFVPRDPDGELGPKYGHRLTPHVHRLGSGCGEGLDTIQPLSAGRQTNSNLPAHS